MLFFYRYKRWFYVQKFLVFMLFLMVVTTWGYASGSSKDASQHTPDFTGIYVVVPDMLSNLQGDDRRNHFLKLCLTLEAKTNADAKRINELMPAIVDAFLVYLRELRIDDLKGAEGIFLLRQQLIDRANAILSPVKVVRVLLREFLVQ